MDSWLRRKHEGLILDTELVEREDLDLVCKDGPAQNGAEAQGMPSCTTVVLCVGRWASGSGACTQQ